MTVATDVTHAQFNGNGVTTVFPFNFRIFNSSDLKVTVIDAAENITPLTLGTDYSISGVGAYAGGSITLTVPLATGKTIALDRTMPVTQETSIRNQGTFLPEIHEDAFDKLTMLSQQTNSVINLRSLLKPNFLSKFFDAVSLRIANLANPVNAQDASTKSYVDATAQSLADVTLANLNRSLRTQVSETLSQLPPSSSRKGKLQAYDSATGDSLLIYPGSVDQQTALNLQSADGYKFIGRCRCVTDLRLIVPLTDGQKIELVSYFSGWSATTYGAFGGGPFTWNANSLLPDDSGGVIKPTAITGPGRWIRDDRNNLNVTHFGADPSGNLDCSQALGLAAAAGCVNIPVGTFKHESITVVNEGITFIGAGMGKTIITSSTSVKMFQIDGTGGGLSYMTLQYTSLHQTPHLITSGSRKSFEYVHFIGFDSRLAQGQGPQLGSIDVDEREQCDFNHCIVEHCSCDVYMSEFKSAHCYFWPISKTFGLRLNGSYCPNAVISIADFVPPVTSYDTVGNVHKAGFWSYGPVLQPILNNCYIDGNPSLVTGTGVLFEEGTLQPQVLGGKANKCSGEVIVFDSCYQPKCTMAFYNCNKSGNGSSDIVLKHTSTTQNLEFPDILSTHIQTASVTGTKGYAVRIDVTISSTPGWKINPSIRQPGDASGYESNEIYLPPTITDPTTIRMSYAQGVRRSGTAIGAVTAAIGTTSATISLGPLALFYVPSADQVTLINTAGDIINAIIQSLTANTVFIVFPQALLNQTTFKARVKLE